MASSSLETLAAKLSAIGGVLSDVERETKHLDPTKLPSATRLTHIIADARVLRDRLGAVQHKLVEYRKHERFCKTYGCCTVVRPTCHDIRNKMRDFWIGARFCDGCLCELYDGSPGCEQQYAVTLRFLHKPKAGYEGVLQDYFRNMKPLVPTDPSKGYIKTLKVCRKHERAAISREICEDDSDDEVDIRLLGRV
jgi:hypothetical protein